MVELSIVLNVILLFIILVMCKRDDKFNNEEFLSFCYYSILSNIDDITIRTDNKEEFVAACKSLLIEKLIDDLELDPEFKLELNQKNQYHLYLHVCEILEEEDILNKLDDKYIELNLENGEYDSDDIVYDIDSITINTEDGKTDITSDLINLMK